MMELQKEYEDIVENLDHESFDSLMDGLEKLLDIIEGNSSKENVGDEFIEKVTKKATEVRNEAALLLKKQREGIIGMADLFGISLSELGITLEDPPEVE
ncbi:hypothetical protein M9Y10_015330 [Tritrichomonas musculus]|uniref:Uncharacterized protein n=1 Tax=Tritrichomonas musculus TaxID=1915356 RepID=A0ABR2L200_9EUKA